jgi:hypothetical protein
VSGLGDQDFSRASEQDRLTEVCFDDTGNHIAVGDKGGRVIVFKYKELKNSNYFEYRYLTEFQSHEPKFDHLSSQEVCESIKRLNFVPNRGYGNPHHAQNQGHEAPLHCITRGPTIPHHQIALT